MLGFPFYWLGNGAWPALLQTNGNKVMENSNINPVSETDMRAFFDRLATTFVGLSDQSRELAELRPQVADITRRLDDLAAERETLRAQIDTLVAERDAARRELDAERQKHSEAMALAESYAKDRDAANSRNADFEQQVQWYTTSLRTRDERVDLLTKECFEARTAVADRDRRITDLENGENYWKARASDLQATVDEIGGALGKLRIAA